MESATRSPAGGSPGRAREQVGRAGAGRREAPPLFVISLDFELYWGIHDFIPVAAYRAHLEGVRRVVPGLLELFRDRDVRATWAAVGFLMLRDVDDLLQRAPARLPGYHRESLCPYRYLHRAGRKLETPLHFAPDLVERILATPGQELGTHTFSHFHCMEAPASVEAFRADLEAARAVARSRFGVELRSLVFPCNRYTPGHVRAAADLGITAYRGNPETWMYRTGPIEADSRLKRLARLADAFLPLSRDLSFALRPAPTVNVPASRFLRPWNPAQRWAEPLRLERIRRELRAAAERGRGYHLWWHPHNFGAHPDENLGALATLLDEFSRLRRTHGMRSVTMNDAAQLARAHVDT